MRHRSAVGWLPALWIAIVCLSVPSPASAQVISNPQTLEFVASTDHHSVDSGTPRLQRYEARVYLSGGSTPVLTFDLGKPSIDSDGKIRINFAALIGPAALAAGIYETRVAAIGPAGQGLSAISNQFSVAGCSYGVSPTSLSFGSAGGSSSVTVTAGLGCAWTTSGLTSWLSAAPSIGIGAATVALTASPNGSSSQRNTNVTIAGRTVNVSQAGLSGPTTYDVGPGKTYSSIGAVPWSSLQPGDWVRIYWRSTPYNEKWVIRARGTTAAPITVSGVAEPGGAPPIIDGAGAATPSGHSHGAEHSGTIIVGDVPGSASPAPANIVIENLDIRGARAGNTFTLAGGGSASYAADAAAIMAYGVEGLTVRSCVLHDSGSGLTVRSAAGRVSRNILLEASELSDTGASGATGQGNVVTEAVGVILQGNRFGLLKSGASGDAVEDRSAGFVARYNWIEGGGRQLDLVDSGSGTDITADASYRRAVVYGNIFLEHAGSDNSQIVRYGGNSGSTANYRNGFLYFYNNTVVSLRTDSTTLLSLSTALERADVRNNILYTTAAGSTFSVVGGAGTLDATRNWIKSGMVVSAPGASTVINDDGSWRTGSAPGFVDLDARDFGLASGSGAIDTGGSLAAAVQSSYPLAGQYLPHRQAIPRPISGAIDIGAYESTAGPPPSGNQPPAIEITSPADGASVPAPATFALTAAATDSDGGIAKVEFFVNGGLNNIEYQYPYEGTYGGAGVGTYTIAAVATDTDGATSTSSPVTVTVTAAATPVQLTPVGDAYVRGGSSASQNYGSSASLEVMNDDNTNLDRHTYMRFDLSGIDSVGSATLRVYGRLAQPGSATTGVYTASSTWDESSITWNSRPSSSGSALGTLSVSTTSASWYELDITSFVRSELNAGRTDVTFVVRSPSSGPYMVFNSKEASSGAPVLYVQY